MHPRWLRTTHWLNAVAFVVLMLSGWRIYNAAPLFDFRFPRSAALGGWLGGALLWHFAAMWLLLGNGIAYLALNVATGRFRRRLALPSWRAVTSDLRAALCSRLSHADPHHYNAVQRTAYLFAIVDTALLVVSGLVLWKSVQFPFLREALGGYEAARRVHFLAMAAMFGFVVLHLGMVALVPRTLPPMLLHGRSA